MTPKESEQMRFELPVISPKTSSEQLKIWSNERWLSNGRKGVAADIVKNAKELLVGNNTDWELVLSSIRNQQLTSLQLGEDAIAVDDARAIGGLGAAAEWPMHHPPMVYLSGGILVARVKESKEFEDFRSNMRNAATSYGHKTLPDADLYMEVLDFLLAAMRNRRHRAIIKKVVSLLANEDIEGALQQSRANVAGRREVIRFR